MGGYTPKCATSRFGIGQRESRLVLRESSNHENQNGLSRNRISSSRPSCTKSSQAGPSEKSKFAKSISRSASGKLVIGSSSKTPSSSSNLKNQHNKSQNSSSHRETTSSEISNTQVRIWSDSQPELSEPRVLKDASLNIPEEVEDHTISNTKTRMRFQQRSSSGNQNNFFGSSKLSSTTNKVSQAASSSSRSGVFRPDRSSTHTFHSRKPEVIRKRNDGECSTSRSRNQSSLPNASKLTISDHSSAPEASKKTRKKALSKDNVASFSGRSNEDNGVITSRHGKGNKKSHPDPLHGIPRRRQSELSIRISSPTSSQQSACTSRQNSHRRQGSSTGTVDSMLTGHLHGLAIDHDSFNPDDFDEVLSALERIEQDRELTYEQRLVLESNLFLDGFSFLDQHRELRLDIDGMSYEELLDLEEKMGTVSTALTEEALLKYVERHIYKFSCTEARSKIRVDGDDVKCTVCQEEYVEEDEVGKLGCEHRYHMVCIHQWLRRKNWCPICKTPVAPNS